MIWGGGHRRAGLGAVDVVGVLAVDDQPHVGGGVLDAALDIAGDDGADDIGTGGRDAPVGGNPADAGTAIDHVVGFTCGGVGPADIGDRQPVRFQFGLPARHRGGDAGNRTAAVASRPHLDESGARGIAVVGVDAAVHAVVGTNAGVLLVQRGGGHVARGNAPAVIDGAYTLRLDLRIHVQRGGIIRIGAVHRARTIEPVRVQAPLVVGVTEHAGGSEIRTKGHAMHAGAIAVGADGAKHMRAVVGVAEAVGLAGGDQACRQ